MTRKRSSPMGLEIYLSAMLAFIMLPLLVQAAPLQDYTEIQQYTEGCYYNYNHYNEGDRIMTNEPCLNCTCHNKMLMCYLRVCPFTKPIGHDCIVEKREDQCCPIITCPEVPVDVAHSAPEPGTELSFPEKFGCSIEGNFYLEGAQVPSNPNKPCELCYCIKNRTSCLMQECTLHIDGCTPIYNKGSCCPVRYNCDHENDVLELEDLSTTTEAATTTTTVRPTTGFIITSTMSPSVSTDCVHNGELYADGARIAGETACENCYCMRGDIICAVQECHMPMLSGIEKNCHAMPAAEGECCPSNYVCEDDTATTQIIESATLPYAGVDEEVKITTSAPIKDLHSAIPEEDLQLQTHIDDEESGTKAPSTDEEKETVTEGSGDVKPIGTLPAVEEPKADEEASTISTPDTTESEEIVTEAPSELDELPEAITEATSSSEEDVKPEQSDEYVTKVPSQEEEEEEKGSEEKVTATAEETSTKASIAADKISELSTQLSVDDHEFATITPMDTELPTANADIAQEGKPEDIVTKAPVVDVVESELTTESPEDESEESTESTDDEIKPVYSDESITKAPMVGEDNVPSEEEHKPVTSDVSVTKAPMADEEEVSTKDGEIISTIETVTKIPLAGEDMLSTDFNEETDEMVTKASLPEESSSTESGEENVSKEASDEEQNPVESDEYDTATIATEETTDAIETNKPEEIFTKAPLAGDVTELPLGAEKVQDEIVTKATVEFTEEQELSTEASGEETDELPTTVSTVAGETQEPDENQELSTDIGITDDEITSVAPAKNVSEDEELSTEGHKEDGKKDTDDGITDEEITFTTPAPDKIISEDEGSKEESKPDIEAVITDEEIKTTTPAKTISKDQELSTESPKEDGIPVESEEEHPGATIDEEIIFTTVAPIKTISEDEELSTKGPKKEGIPDTDADISDEEIGSTIAAPVKTIYEDEELSTESSKEDEISGESEEEHPDSATSTTVTPIKTISEDEELSTEGAKEEGKPETDADISDEEIASTTATPVKTISEDEELSTESPKEDGIPVESEEEHPGATIDEEIASTTVAPIKTISEDEEVSTEVPKEEGTPDSDVAISDKEIASTTAAPVETISEDEELSTESPKEDGMPVEEEHPGTAIDVEIASTTVAPIKTISEDEELSTEVPKEEGKPDTDADISDEEIGSTTAAPVKNISEDEELSTESPKEDGIPVESEEHPAATIDEEIASTTVAPIKTISEDEEVSTEVPKEEGKPDSDVAITDEEIASTTAAPVKTIYEDEELSTEGPKEEEKPIESEEDHPDTDAAISDKEITSTTAAPVKTVSEEKELSSEGPEEEGKPTVAPLETISDDGKLSTEGPQDEETHIESGEVKTDSDADRTDVEISSTTVRVETVSEGDELSTEGPAQFEEEQPEAVTELDKSEVEEQEITKETKPDLADELTIGDSSLETEKTTETSTQFTEGDIDATIIPSAVDEDMEMGTKAPADEISTKSPMSVEENYEISTEYLEEDKLLESSGEGKPIASDELPLDVTTVAPTKSEVEEDHSNEPSEDHKLVTSDEFGSGDYNTESSAEETYQSSSVSTSTESVISAPQKEEDIAAIKPIENNLYEEEEQTSATATMDTSESEEDNELDVTTIKSFAAEKTTSGIKVDSTTTKPADEEKAETEEEVDDQVDITTMATSIDKEIPSREQQKDKLPEEITNVEKDSSEEASSEEDKTKPESIEESMESEEETTQKAIDEASQVTSMAPVINIITEADDQHKVMPESDDHKTEEQAGITDSPMVIMDNMSEFTTPEPIADEGIHTESESDREQEVEATTKTDEISDGLPSLDNRVDLDEGVPATTVKTFTEEPSAVDMQLPSVIPGEGDCLVGQKTYGNNTVVPTSDECEITCRCVSSIISCERVICEVPHNIDDCTLDEASTNKCCPSYICGGTDGIPSKTDDSSESVEEDEDEEIQYTTIATPHEYPEKQPTKEIDQKSEDTTVKPDVVPEEPITVAIPEIEIAIASTEEPMSHVKDDDEKEQQTSKPIDDLAEDKTDVATDNEVSTTPAVAVEDIVVSQSVTPVDTSEKETDQEISPEIAPVDISQEISTKIPIDQEQPEKEIDEHTTFASVSVDAITDSYDQASSEEEKEDTKISDTTTTPSVDEYQTVQPIKKEDNEEKTDDEIMVHTLKPTVSKDEIHTTPATLAESETQTVVPVDFDKETSEDQEAHTAIPTQSSEEDTNILEPEDHGVPTSSSEEEDQTSGEIQTATPVDAENEEPETQTETVSPVETQEKTSDEIEASTPVAAKPTSEEPSKDLEIQTSDSDSTEDITVIPSKDHDKEYAEEEEDIDHTTSVPPITDTEEQLSTDAPKQPSSSAASISEEETEEDHTDSTLAEKPKEEDASEMSVTPISDGDNEDDTETHTETHEEKPIKHDSEDTTAAVSFETGTPSAVAPITHDESDVEITTVPTSAPAVSFEEESTLESIKSDVPSSEDETQTGAAPAMDEEISSYTTSASIEGSNDNQPEIDTSSEGADKETVDTATNKPIVFETKIDVATSIKKDNEDEKEKDSAEEQTDSTSVEEEGTIATMVPNAEETADVTTPVEDDIRKITTVSSVQEGEPDSIEKATESSEEKSDENVTVPTIEQDKDELEPSLPHTVDEKEIEKDQQVGSVSDDQQFETSPPISTTSIESSEEESTDKMDMAPVQEDKIVPEFMPEKDKPISPVKNEVQSTIAPVKQPSLDLSEEESGESIESDEEINTEQPKIQHIGEFVTERVEEYTIEPTAQPITDENGEKASVEEGEDIESATAIVQLTGDQLENDVTTSTPVKVSGTSESDEVSTEKLSEDEFAISTVTKAPTSEEKDISEATMAPEDFEQSEEDVVPSTTKSPFTAEDIKDFTPEQAEENVVPSATKAPFAPEDVEGVIDDKSEQEDVLPMSTNAPLAPEDVTAAHAEDVGTMSDTKAPFSAEGTTEKIHEQEEDISTATNAPFNPEDINQVSTEHAQDVVPSITKAPFVAEDIEGTTDEIPEQEDVSLSATNAPLAHENTTAEHAEDVVPSVTKAPFANEDTEVTTDKIPKQEDVPSSTTNASFDHEEIENVTSEHVEDVESVTDEQSEGQDGIPAVTKAPIVIEDIPSVTAQLPIQEDGVSSVTKTPFITEEIEDFTTQQTDEQDVNVSTSKAPMAAEDTGIVGVKKPEDNEDAFAVTTAPMDAEEIDTATPKLPEIEDVSTPTKAPVASDELYTTAAPLSEEEEVDNSTQVQETSEETEGTTDKLPTQESDEIFKPEVTHIPSSDFEEDIVTKAPEQDVIAVITKAPFVEEGYATEQPKEEADMSPITEVPISTEEIDLTSAEPSKESDAESDITFAPEEEFDATTAKVQPQQFDAIPEDTVTQVPTTNIEKDKTDEVYTDAPKISEEAAETTTAKISDLAEQVTELPTKDTEKPTGEEATELPAVAHGVSSVGESTETAVKEGEEESSEELSSEGAEEVIDDSLQPTTTSHPLFPYITTMPTVAFDSRIDNTNATESSVVPTKDAEEEQDSYTTLPTTTSTSTTSAPITTSAPHYQQKQPVYGQQPQYGPSQYEDEYTDEDEGEVFGPGTCRYGGKLYVSAQQIPRDDPCDFCFCFRSDIICLQQSCPPPISGCHEEPISGFCCPRYECPVSMAAVLNITTSTTTTSTTLPPHFLHHSYGNNVQRNGCLINGRSYRVGEKIESTSGPCINCTCGGDGKMKCDPQACVPEPTMQQVMAVVAAGRKR